MEADRYLDRLRAQHQPWADDWLRELYEWDALEDEPERSRLAREFQAEDDGVFMAAAFELFLSGSFRQRGWRVERHPSIQGTKRVPDYLVHAGSGDFYVEAVLALESNARMAQHGARRALAKALEPVQGAFHVLVTPLGEWDGRFSRKNVRRFLEHHIRDLEAHPEEPERTIVYDQDEHLAVRFEIWRVTTVGPVVGGWSLTGDAAIRVTTHLTLADAIEKKTSRYGQLGLPYIVAVQPFTDFPAESHSIREALFGTQEHTFSHGPGRFEYVGTRTLRNGIFSSVGSRGQAIRTRLSAVALYKHWTDGRANHRHEIALFHNPFTVEPLNPAIFDDVPQLVSSRPVEDQIKLHWMGEPPEWADSDHAPNAPGEAESG